MKTKTHKVERERERGFTLIELLVVISIIGLLSSIVMASLVTAKQKAQDSALLQNIKQLQLAMEMYRNDHGNYPQLNYCDTATLGYCDFDSTQDPQNLKELEDALVPKYIPSINLLSYKNYYEPAGLGPWYSFDLANPNSMIDCKASFKEYYFMLYNYDSSNRKINLPSPMNGDFSCFGV